MKVSGQKDLICYVEIEKNKDINKKRQILICQVFGTHNKTDNNREISKFRVSFDVYWKTLQSIMLKYSKTKKLTQKKNP